MKVRPEIWVFIAALIILSSVWFVPYVISATSQGIGGPFGSPVVTMDKYRLIGEGDTYEKVKRTFGGPGISGDTSFTPAASGREAAQIVAYTWMNGDGSNVVAVFRNDQLITKAQSGLK